MPIMMHLLAERFDQSQDDKYLEVRGRISLFVSGKEISSIVSVT